MTDYQYAELSGNTNDKETRLSYFNINANGRTGYAVSCFPWELSFRKIDSINGMPTYRRVFTRSLRDF